MRVFYSISFFIIMFSSANAQKTNGKIVYKYSVSTLPASLANNTSITNTLLANLYFNDTSSFYQEINPAIKTQNETKQLSDNSGVIITASTDSIFFEHYFNANTKRSFIREKIMLYKFMDYAADTLTPVWILEQEFKNIGAYQCQKATTNFSGRTWVAWFTTSIPLGYGPWKLQGLPGMILEARDIENKFSFEMASAKIPERMSCNGICAKSRKGEVKMSFPEFKTLVKKRQDKIEALLTSQLSGDMSNVSITKGETIDKYFLR